MKLYLCTTCGDRLCREGYVKKHIKDVDNKDGDYECDLCGKISDLLWLLDVED